MQVKDILFGFTIFSRGTLIVGNFSVLNGLTKLCSDVRYSLNGKSALEIVKK